MAKPEFKLLPCVFCTIGFNCYVAGHRVVSGAYHGFSKKVLQPKNPEPVKAVMPIFYKN